MEPPVVDRNTHNPPHVTMVNAGKGEDCFSKI